MDLAGRLGAGKVLLKSHIYGGKHDFKEYFKLKLLIFIDFLGFFSIFASFKGVFGWVL